MPLYVIVLAAGQGKRMHSSLPKVLHRLAGRPLLAYVLDAARSVDAQGVVKQRMRLPLCAISNHSLRRYLAP